MRITKADYVAIESEGGRGAYGDALVQGEFLGTRYYALDQVCKVLDMTAEQVKEANQSDDWNGPHGVTCREKIEKELDPAFTRGRIVE
jgi:hypothetical protein